MHPRFAYIYSPPSRETEPLSTPPSAAVSFLTRLESINHNYNQRKANYLKEQQKKLNEELQQNLQTLGKVIESLNKYAASLTTILASNLLHDQEKKKCEAALNKLESMATHCKNLQTDNTLLKNNKSQLLNNWNLEMTELLNKEVESFKNQMKRYEDAQKDLDAAKNNPTLLFYWSEAYEDIAIFSKDGSVSCDPSYLTKILNKHQASTNVKFETQPLPLRFLDKKAWEECKAIKIDSQILINEYNRAKKLAPADMRAANKLTAADMEIEAQTNAIIEDIKSQAKEALTNYSSLKDCIDGKEEKGIWSYSLKEGVPLDKFIKYFDRYTQFQNPKPKDEDIKQLNLLTAKTSPKSGINPQKKIEEEQKEAKTRIEKSCLNVPTVANFVNTCKNTVANAEVIDLLHSAIKNNVHLWNKLVCRWGNLKIKDEQDNTLKAVPTGIAQIYQDLNNPDSALKTIAKMKKHQETIKGRLNRWFSTRRSPTEEFYQIFKTIGLNQLNADDVKKIKNRLESIRIEGKPLDLAMRSITPESPTLEANNIIGVVKQDR